MLNGQTAYVISPVTGLYQTPPEIKQKISVLDTELLSGEAVVLSGQTTDNGFVHITALHDGYRELVKLAELAKPPEAFSAMQKYVSPLLH